MLAKKFLAKKLSPKKLFAKNTGKKNAGTFSRTERIPAQYFNFEEMEFLKNQAVSRIGSSFGSRST